MKHFDQALDEFTYACIIAADWKHNFFGAAYRTRLEAAFAEVKRTYENACRVDDQELGRVLSTKPNEEKVSGLYEAPPRADW